MGVCSEKQNIFLSADLSYNNNDEYHDNNNNDNNNNNNDDYDDDNNNDNNYQNRIAVLIVGVLLISIPLL